jgi:hypothetical protein
MLLTLLVGMAAINLKSFAQFIPTNRCCSSLINQVAILVFYRLNSAIGRGTKPNALGCQPCHWTTPPVCLDVIALWQAVAGLRRVQSRNALRMNSRRTWRHSEGSRNVHHTASRRALSPSHPSGSVTAGVHGGPRGVAPLRHHTASRDTPVAAHGRRNDSSCDARPPRLFSPPGHGLATTRCSSEAIDMTAH